MRYAMVIDLSKCVGCNACVEACKIEHGTGFGVKYTRIEEVELGSFPDVKKAYVPLQCMHCEDPECLKVCATGATYKAEGGAVLIDQDKCSGCKYCMVACPYGARFFYEDKARPKDLLRMDSEEERKGAVEKCDLCIDRLRVGREPACVEVCPTRARIFGDADDEKSEVHELISSGRAKALKPEHKPSIYYIW
ncbi:MAG: 4Fe-4S dicluster domain-containing protein [Desulfurococcales archaeon]|jgi:molybdopterin-containing oxidoreductase family iron-sulfur binding subunit|nr:4Fe-4S dicluster domain-containing protein [Desulfurococcales archaeon]